MANTPDITQQQYVPSSLEKKRIILVYALLGIFVYLGREEQTPYEMYHVRWATGWWMLFLVSLFILLIPALIIPLFWIVLILVYVPLFGMWFYSIQQAWTGLYKEDGNKSALALFYGLGGWFFDIFEVKTEQSVEQKNVVVTNAPPIQETQGNQDTSSTNQINQGADEASLSSQNGISSDQNRVEDSQNSSNDQQSNM